MSVVKPSLALAIPVYNGVSAGIQQLVEGLLADAFDNTEIVISDNGSSDGTPDILRDLAKSDPRIHLNLFRANQGIQANFNRVLADATADLFKWTAVGDWVLPGYLERSVAHLRAHPETTLAHCVYDFHDGTKRISTGEHWRRTFDRKVIAATEHRLPAVRVVGNLKHYGYGGHIFGVTRRELLVRLGGHTEYAGSDRVVTAELAALGPMHWDRECLWSCYCPVVEKADYTEDGLLDGDDYPDIEAKFLERRNYGSLPRQQALGIRVAVEARRFEHRVRSGIRSRVRRLRPPARP